METSQKLFKHYINNPIGDPLVHNGLPFRMSSIGFKDRNVKKEEGQEKQEYHTQPVSPKRSFINLNETSSTSIHNPQVLPEALASGIAFSVGTGTYQDSQSPSTSNFGVDVVKKMGIKMQRKQNFNTGRNDSNFMTSKT